MSGSFQYLTSYKLREPEISKSKAKMLNSVEKKKKRKKIKAITFCFSLKGIIEALSSTVQWDEN